MTDRPEFDGQRVSKGKKREDDPGDDDGDE